MTRLLLLLAAMVSLCCAPVFASQSKPSNYCKISHPSDDEIEWDCHRLKRKETLEGLFGDRWQDVARFNRMDRRHAYPGISIKVPKNLDDISDYSPLPDFLPSRENEAKFILIDLSEQFLGAYEFGRLFLSFPIASGDRKNRTPTGEFRVMAFNRNHKSSLYKIEKTVTPYPMHYGLMFYINPAGVAFWLHGRDVPGYAASHGCIGLYDEAMQKEFYRTPRRPVLDDAKTLFEWATELHNDDGELHYIDDGPKVLIVGKPSY